MAQPLVIATGNPHKVSELRAIFAARGITVVGLADLAGPFHEPEEIGRTFEENAAIKALSYAAQTRRMCLADDSGLEVDALGGAPGVISSHYSTNGVETGMTRAERDAANNQRLLKELSATPRGRRSARFVCQMCVAVGDQILAVARGTFEGCIGAESEVPRGNNGFGYDPLFVLEDGRTSAELSEAEKNARSHRGIAARALAVKLAKILK